MVIEFSSNAVTPPMHIYMGRDKHENEELIRWGWPEDVWFHVDKLSSAHIYLRLTPGMTIDTIPEEVLNDCIQLTKANSIQGSKQNHVNIVYTPWSNLKKTGSMDVGQVGFHNDKDVRYAMVEKKCNEIINRLNKTKVEREINYRLLREDRDREERTKERAKQLEEKALNKLKEEQKRERENLTSYASLMDENNMRSNIDDPIDEDDFM
ncbi:coiled-coil domain-containing protein 25 [Hydra vulgaris]|uniref:Coiled-coil domain-containing protein 25 n=1 Tax=Hydra vulgaris TaxID=6087 RepID=T2M9R8_HYDVU|nr:coiled-coil domain-containing protein 25 [Hydra vulgaris]